MIKKILLLGLSLLLVFYPTAIFAAETENEQNNEQPNNTAVENITETDFQGESTEVEQLDSEVDNSNLTKEETNTELDNTGETVETEEQEEGVTGSGDSDDSINSTETTESALEQDTNNNESSENDEEQKPDSEDTTVNNKETISDDSAEIEEDTNPEDSSEVEEGVNPEDSTDDSISEEEEEKVEEETSIEQADEDLDLTNIYGAINQSHNTTIQYDFNKGYYVLELQAGLSNMSRNQVLNEKWVAFALPDGVKLAGEDIPAGVVQLHVNGKNGIAIKIPDVKEFPDSQYVYPDVPLVGEPNDNDPVLNLYLYNVNVDEMTYENIGQIQGQRNIDFTEMQGIPELDIDGSFTGKSIFDAEKGHYVLDLTVDVTNNTESDITSIYGGFTLPEGVAIIQTEDNLEGVEILDLGDGLQTVAIKLPELSPDENEEVSYQIPLLGKTTENIASSTITTYTINGYYQEVGQFNGSINIDLSEMQNTWNFSAESQIVEGFPGLGDNEIGLRFGFDTQNLTFYSIEKVKVEFQVPNDITIHEPDSYDQGEIPDSLKDFLDGDAISNENLDLSWDGNKATINLETVDGANIYQGFFTAFGETTSSLENLEGLNVLVTLYQNGEEIVQELYVPFEIVSYEGDDGQPERPGDEPEEEPGNEEETPSNDEDDVTDEDDSSDDNGKDKDQDSDNNQNDNNEQAPNDNNNDDNEQDNINKNVDNDNNTNKETTNNNSEGAELPDSATNMYSMLLFGAVLTVAGIVLFLVRKRKLV